MKGMNWRIIAYYKKEIEALKLRHELIKASFSSSNNLEALAVIEACERECD